MTLDEIEINSPPLSGNGFMTAGRFIRHFRSYFIKMLVESQWNWRCFLAALLPCGEGFLSTLNVSL